MALLRSTRASRLALLAPLAASALLAATYLPTRPPPPAPDQRSAEVIARFFPDQGSPFSSHQGAFLSASEPAPGQRPADAMVVSAPARAGGVIDIGGKGRTSGVQLSVVGATDAAPVARSSALIYPGGLPGADLALVRDPGWVELLFVVHQPELAPPLALRLALRDRALQIRPEPLTGALLLSSTGGQAVARLDAPVAIDADGQRRTGSYAVRGDELALQLPLDGLRPPILVDPTVTLPAWSIDSASLAPGGTIYDATRLSRETTTSLDLARDRMVLVRPIRTQQLQDAFMLLGDMWGDGDFATYDERAQRISSIARTGTFVASEETTTAWKRGYQLEDETWEFDGTSWKQNLTARLPGRIGPAMAFDPARSRTVLFGGAASDFRCVLNPLLLSYNDASPFSCLNQRPDENATYEYDGSQWVTRRIPGSPTPRLRPAMAWDQHLQRMVLFGGRALDSNATSLIVKPEGKPFPENMTSGLLNDTWLFDGTSWSRVPTGQPPPPREGAQLVHDPLRGVTLLVGGHTADQDDAHSDLLALWEFDGLDWIDRLGPIAHQLPLDLRTRRSASAFWNPARQRLTLFGGHVPRLDRCPLSDGAIAAQIEATQGDPAGREALAATGCLGGYLHDTWEWTGTSFERLTDVTFGGLVDGVAVFRQATGAAWGAGSLPTTTPPAPAAQTPLWPWRYATHDDVFPLRSTLERAHQKPSSAPDLQPPPGSPPPAPGAPAVSPLFTSAVRPDLFVRADGNASIVPAGEGRVYQTNGAAWGQATVAASPFALGRIDFFAATWDTVRQQIVLFEPSRGETWVHDPGAGWSRKQPATSPPAWSLGPHLRSFHDAQADALHFEQRLALVGQAMPLMSFDAAQGLAHLLYDGQFWQWNGATWQLLPAPPGWTGCEAGSALVHDEARGRTVLFGCTVPSRTLEWDGASWSAPGPGPHQALITRDDGDLSKTFLSPLTTWQGTLQLPVLHPNHATYSSLQGGVVTLDADGTLRRWNGSTWEARAALPSAQYCVISEPGSVVRKSIDGFPFPINPHSLLGRESIPLCFFPPLVEDTLHDRLIAFRDGPRGMTELVRDEGTDAWSWRPVKLGNNYSNLSGIVFVNDLYSVTRANPYPFELMTPELARSTSLTDPASRQYPPGIPPAQLPKDKWRVEARTVDNAWWSFRLLRNPQNQQVAMLTHRGALWQLGGETLKGLGAPCSSSLECGEGSCTVEGVCCNVSTCGEGKCTTCKGTHPGTCEVVAAGQPEPQGRCGSGECAGLCSGLAGPAACQFDAARPCGAAPSCTDRVLTPGGHCAPVAPACIQPGQGPACPVVDGQPDLTAMIGGYPCAPAPTACPGGLSCDTATTCKGTCTSRADCLSRYETCDATATTCVPDQASLVAASRGITPVDWTPPRRKTNQEIAAELVDAGYVADDEGRFRSQGPSSDLDLAFNPALVNPLEGAIACSQKILLCTQLFKSVDRCVASMSRCAGSTPWLGDPAGQDCCPEPCILEFFARRTSQQESYALRSITDGSCYPGLASYLAQAP